MGRRLNILTRSNNIKIFFSASSKYLDFVIFHGSYHLKKILPLLAVLKLFLTEETFKIKTT